MGRSWSILRTGAALAALTGCATVEQPGPAPVSASPSGTPAYYTGLSGECPVLKSAESARFTGSRAGRHIPAPGKITAVERIDCHWRPPSDAPPWVTVTVTIFLDRGTAHERAERDFTQARDEAMSRAETDPSQAVRTAERATSHGPALVMADAAGDKVTGGTDDLSQTTRIGNVVVRVLLLEKRNAAAGGSARADELMAGLAATSEAITAEIAGQLVSQA
jgi:hypothetical protein